MTIEVTDLNEFETHDAQKLLLEKLFDHVTAEAPLVRVTQDLKTDLSAFRGYILDGSYQLDIRGSYARCFKDMARAQLGMSPAWEVSARVLTFFGKIGMLRSVEPTKTLSRSEYLIALMCVIERPERYFWVVSAGSFDTVILTPFGMERLGLHGLVLLDAKVPEGVVSKTPYDVTLGNEYQLSRLVDTIVRSKEGSEDQRSPRVSINKGTRKGKAGKRAKVRARLEA